MDIVMLLFWLLGFLAVVAALEGLYNLWASNASAQARRIRDRLAALRGETMAEVAIERVQQGRRLPWFQNLLDRVEPGRRLSAWVRASGTNASAGELILLSGGLAMVGLLLPGLLGRPPIFGLAVGLLFGVMPWLRVGQQRARRVARFERQFPEALDLMARALRAGHAFPTAIKMVGEEVPEPLGREFRILFDEMNYGVSAPDALAHLAGRVPLADVSYFVVAVMIQRESGGNLAELLDKISAIVRARLKLLGDVRTLSAEGRLSAIILTCLPFVVALVINLINPQFMSVLWTDPVGVKLIAAALVLMILGVLWMRQIVRIRV